MAEAIGTASLMATLSYLGFLPEGKSSFISSDMGYIPILSLYKKHSFWARQFA
mgnify:CR=1